MQFSTTFLAALAAATSVVAAPAAAASKNMMATSTQWTIDNMKRVCLDGTCTWTFGIDTHSGSVTACKFLVKAPAGTANHANGGPATCGAFTVTSGWSGQFGAGKGFTTLSVIEESKKLIVYPAYTDVQLNPGKVVTPNQSYTPQTLG